MAYGAMLRLCAARGQPERAIGLLEDMERFEVKPTTLCFSAALRSVARSHETAIRFERGWSRRDMLRETTAAHHGKMARQIVILAEVTEVEHDDGFISALMLCTAAAGDSATTKAVLLASEVRKMDHLRTIGGSRQEAFENHDDDLQLESGEMTTAMTTTNIDAELAIGGKSQKSYNNNKDISTYTEREYGKDTRVISALIHSCAQAMNKNGIGTMWAGRENLGSLDENSLRLITTRWEPSYVDTSVPGVSSTKVGIGALRRMDEKEKYEELKPGKRKKFRGLYIDDEDLITIDDIEDGDDSTDWNGENDTLVGEDDLFSDDNEPLQNLLEYQTSDHNDDEQQEDSVPQYTQSEVFEKFLSELKDEATKNGEKFDLSEVEARELFDMMHDEFLESDDDDDDDDDDDEDENEPSISEEYDQFLAELKKQSEENDEKFDLNDVQVQELFDMMQNEYDDDSNENKRDIASYDEVGGNDLTTNDNENSVLPEDKASKAVLANIDPTQLSKIEDLQSALPGMPLSRLKKIVDAYEETLGHPSMLKLVPILRETMPDTLSSGWLKRNNKKNADFALLKATEDGLVDSALLNSMLQVKANSGSLNEALEHHADHFAKHKLVSTTTMKYGFVCAYKTKRFT
jgi:pentatricopeptide repeat protein